MRSHERQRPDDPASPAMETSRLARDEYDRPRYGSAARAFGTPSHAPQRPAYTQVSSPIVRVHEVMTRRVATVHPPTSVERAAQLMAECDCGGLPVIGENGVLVGIVTDRDIALRIVARGCDARYAVVADCMTPRVFACYANESVTECMRQMARHQVRRMPIVDNGGRLVGIVSQGDLARHAAQRPALDEQRAFADAVSAVSEPLHALRR